LATRRRQVYELDAENAKLFDAYRELDDAQRKSLAESTKGAQAAKNQGKAVSYLKGEWKALVGTALGFIGVNQLIQQGIGLLRDYDERLKKISETQTKTAKGAVPLAALQAPEDVSRVLREAAAISAAEGISPEQGFNMFQRAQSVYGTFEEGKPQAVAAMRLAKLTQDPESAAEAIKIAYALGMTQEEFNSVLVGMAASSAADEAVFTRVSPFWSLFTGEGGEPEKYTGAAITNVLSQRIASEQLPTYVQAVSRTLTDVEDPIAQAITKDMEGTGRTFADLSNIERIRAIGQYVEKEYREISPEALKKAGITEQRESTAMATILAPDNLKRLEQILSEAPEMGERYRIEDRLGAISQEPIIRQKLLEEQTAAVAEATAMMGPESERARERAARVRAQGAEAGFGWGIDPETGEAGRLRRAAMIGEGSVQRPGAYGMYYQVAPESPRPSEQERLKEALEKQTQVLQEIAENTKSDKRSKPSETVSVRPEVE
jgi:hypothetical protein